MATASTVIDANQTGVSYTSYLNAALAAVNTCHSGIAAPTNEVLAGKFWLDTSGTDPVLKVYRSGWKSLFTLKATSTELEADAADITNEVRVGASNELVLAQDSTLSEIRSDNLAVQNLAGTESILTAVADGAVTLFYDNASKLATSATGVTITGTATATDFNTTSDERLKSNITKLGEDSLETVLSLQGVRYTMKGKTNIGLLAQAVQKVVPEVVTEGGDGYLGVNYGNIVAHLIEAVKSQQTQIEFLKGKVNALQTR